MEGAPEEITNIEDLKRRIDASAHKIEELRLVDAGPEIRAPHWPNVSEDLAEDLDAGQMQELEVLSIIFEDIVDTYQRLETTGEVSTHRRQMLIGEAMEALIAHIPHIRKNS